MLNKGILITLLVSVCILAVGCQEESASITAVEIAEEEGILNADNDNTAIVSIIQSGQADKMLEKGHMVVEHETRSQLGTTVLVSKYKIGGETYRIEVRRQVKPLKNIEFKRIHHARFVRDNDYNYIPKLNKLYKCIQEKSFEAQPEVAYRAWKGLDGKTRRIEILYPPKPQWISHEKDMNLYIKTKEWPLPVMWLRGLTSDGRRRPVNGFLNYDMRNSAVKSETQDIRGCDGRWIMESPGPGVVCGPFINMDLYATIVTGAKDHWVSRFSASDGHTLVSNKEERRRKLEAIRDMQNRELQQDWDWFWRFDQASNLPKWEIDAPE